MPAPKELQAHYTESFYSVMLPERDEQNGVTFRDYRELVLEMVAQRLSQDFQLVSAEDTSEVGDKDGTVFRLSMGHRIHEIVYNEETQTIDVKRYLQKVTTPSPIWIGAFLSRKNSASNTSGIISTKLQVARSALMGVLDDMFEPAVSSGVGNSGDPPIMFIAASSANK